MWTWLVDALRQHPELALFLTLAIGYSAGRLRIGTFRVGPVLGALGAGVVVGQLGIPVPEALKNALFLLFLLSIGYTTGPLFFRGLKSTALPQVGLTVLLCTVALVTAYAVSIALGFDAGASGGLLAGAMTSSPALGTVGDSLRRLSVDPAEVEAWMASRTVAFAVTYLVGMALVVWLLSRAAPRLMRVDLAAECRRLETEMGVAPADVGPTAYSEFVLRAYAIPDALAGGSVAELERRFGDQRVFVERVRRAGRIADEVEPGQRLDAGDHVALAGRQSVLAGSANPLHAHEADDRELLDLPVADVDVILTRKEFAGRELGELGQDVGARGAFLRRLTRAGMELPFTRRTIVERGDVLRLSGTKTAVARVADRLGYAEWPTAATDMTSVALAILLGGLVGLPVLALGRVELGLSLFVGVLLGGLVLGWLRSIHRSFGFIPEPALWLFDSFGLTGFLALVGLEAGPDFVRGITQSGLVLVAAGVIVVTVPHVLTILVGRHWLKLHPGILLGVCCGAGTSAPALAAVQETARSRIPALGYGVGCALGNVILALFGGVIVLVT
jgi:putative transport protein